MCIERGQFARKNECPTSWLIKMDFGICMWHPRGDLHRRCMWHKHITSAVLKFENSDASQRRDQVPLIATVACKCMQTHTAPLCTAYWFLMVCVEYFCYLHIRQRGVNNFETMRESSVKYKVLQMLHVSVLTISLACKVSCTSNTVAYVLLKGRECVPRKHAFCQVVNCSVSVFVVAFQMGTRKLERKNVMILLL